MDNAYATFQEAIEAGPLPLGNEQDNLIDGGAPATMGQSQLDMIFDEKLFIDRNVSGNVPTMQQAFMRF